MICENEIKKGPNFLAKSSKFQNWTTSWKIILWKTKEAVDNCALQVFSKSSLDKTRAPLHDLMTHISYGFTAYCIFLSKTIQTHFYKNSMRKANEHRSTVDVAKYSEMYDFCCDIRTQTLYYSLLDTCDKYSKPCLFIKVFYRCTITLVTTTKIDECLN